MVASLKLFWIKEAALTLQASSDIYGLAMVAVLLLTGVEPWANFTMSEVTATVISLFLCLRQHFGQVTMALTQRRRPQLPTFLFKEMKEIIER